MVGRTDRQANQKKSMTTDLYVTAGTNDRVMFTVRAQTDRR